MDMDFGYPKPTWWPNRKNRVMHVCRWPVLTKKARNEATSGPDMINLTVSDAFRPMVRTAAG